MTASAVRTASLERQAVPADRVPALPARRQLEQRADEAPHVARVCVSTTNGGEAVAEVEPEGRAEAERRDGMAGAAQ